MDHLPKQVWYNTTSLNWGKQRKQRKKLSLVISNPFLKNTAEAMVKLFQNRKPNCLKEVLATPMWHNPVLQIQYRNEWKNKGINLIGDIIDRNLKS